MGQRSRGAAACSALVIEAVLLYRRVAALWWTFDDVDLLHINTKGTVSDLFTDGRMWPQQLFTPLLNVAFKMESAAFGLDTSRWYATQLAICAIAALALYACCRLYLDALASWSAAALFLAAPAVISIVAQLSTVHYLLAIIGMAASFIAYVHATRHSERRRARGSRMFLSAALYLLAMLAKEVAIPLPLILACLPEGKTSARLRHLTGHAAALALYIAWRRSVIGAFFGAYGWVVQREEWPWLIAAFPARVVKAAIGNSVVAGSVVIAVILIVVLLAVRTRRGLLLIGAAAIAVLLPLLPVAKEINRRYLAVPWLAASAAFAAGANRLPNRRAAAVLLGVVPLLCVVANRTEWSAERASRQRMSREARAFVELPPNGLLRLPSVPPALMPELNWLRDRYLGGGSGAGWFFDDCYLCSHDLSGRRVWQFDADSRHVEEITPRVAAIKSRFCNSIRTESPLALRLAIRKPALHWEFGPYRDGTYTAVLYDGLQAFVVPRKAALNLPGAVEMTIRLRYDSPAGWTTYSPDFHLDFTRPGDVAWTR